MDKQQIKQALHKANNDAAFINVTKVAAVLGVQPETAQSNYLRTLDYIQNGRSKLYFIDDVAESIFEHRQRGYR